MIAAANSPKTISNAPMIRNAFVMSALSSEAESQKRERMSA
jgi:hypothetical protein